LTHLNETLPAITLSCEAQMAFSTADKKFPTSMGDQSVLV
jgi:hypothetical protein